MPISLGGYPAEEPAVIYRACMDAGTPVVGWWGKANSYRHTFGATAGRGWLLMNWSNLKNLDTRATSGHELVFWDDYNKLTLKRIELVRMTCVLPSSGSRTTEKPQDNEIYLVEIADRRSQIARQPHSKSYNVRSPDGADYYSGSKNAGSAWTWVTLLTDLWDANNFGTSYPGLGWTPDGTPEQFDYQDGWYSLAAFDHVLTRLGTALTYDPSADTFGLQRWSPASRIPATVTAWTDLDTKAVKDWDSYPKDPQRQDRPEKVRVLFLKFPAPGTGGARYLTEDVTLTASDDAIAGTFVTLYDDLASLGTNGAAVTSRATERANDWLRIYLGVNSRVQVQYYGFWPQGIAIIGGGEALSCTWLDIGGGPKTVLESVDPKLLENWRPAYTPPGTTTNPPMGAAITVVGDVVCDGAGNLVVDYVLAVTSAPLQVSGRITTGGVAVAGRTVEIQPVGGGTAVNSTTTNSSGFYLMSFDPPSGTYWVVSPGSATTPSNYALIYSSSPAYLTGRNFTV